MKETTIFQSGNSQAMRIPKEMRFASEKVFIEKIGSITVILDSSDPWASLKLAQIMFAGKFMLSGRSVNPIIEREGLSEGSKK